MCGIAGHVAAGQPELCRRTVGVMVDLLKRRGIPCFTYAADDWEADAEAIAEFERRRKIG